jgi:hypothetical protein
MPDEDLLRRLWERLLREQKKRVLKRVPKGMPATVIWGPFWEDEMKRLHPAVHPTLQEIAEQGAIATSEMLGIGVDISLVNYEALTWAQNYTYELISGINATSQKVVAKAFENAVLRGYTRGQIEEAIAPTFGPARAEMIAVTETTRAYAEGNEIGADEIRRAGIELNTIWLTNADDLVCDICAPLHNKKRGDGWTDLPPAHVNCRCGIAHEIA